MRLTIPAAMDRAASRFGDQIAIAEPAGPRLSYREMHDRATGIAAALAAAGIDAGDRVAIWSPNTHHWVLAALGALSAGATLVPVSTRFTGPEALDVIGRSGATALFVAGPFVGVDRLSALRAADQAEPDQLGSLRLIIRIPVADGPPAAEVSWPGVTVADWADLDRKPATAARAAATARAAAVCPDDVSDILYTSGTTGRSKGAMSSHRQALEVARAWADCGAVTSADRYLVVNPFFHSFGYKAGVLVCLLTGATIVPQLVFDAEQAMRLIESERITVLPGAPTIYQSILDHPGRSSHDLSTLRLAVTGAAVVPVALVERMQAELSFDTVLTAYGLTEAVVVTMCRPGDPARTVATTSGRATAGFEIRLALPEPDAAGRDGADLADVGEVLLRGPNVMLGYARRSGSDQRGHRRGRLAAYRRCRPPRR